MKKYIFILLSTIVFGQNVQSSDSTKVQILLNLSGSVINSEPKFTNISGISYYSSQKFPGMGLCGDISVFFTKNMGLEIGMAYQNIPSKITVKIPANYTYKVAPYTSVFNITNHDLYISVGPSFKFNLLKKLSLSFSPNVIFSNNYTKNPPIIESYSRISDTSYYAYNQMTTLTKTRVDFLLKPSLIYHFNKYLSLNFDYIIRLSKNNISEGKLDVLPDYPTLHSTADYVQKTSYRGFSLGLELNISSIAKSISNKFKSEK